MNLNSLFPKQQKLDEHILNEKNLHEQDLFKRKVVAFLTELFECTNEGRWFKFWSENQKPKNKETKIIECEECEGSGLLSLGEGIRGVRKCDRCLGRGYMKFVYNPLLEEYADIVHFLISLANDLGYKKHTYTQVRDMDLNDLVIGIDNVASLLPVNKMLIQDLFDYVIKLGYQLGFTEQDVLNAYDDKNKENHRRQETNY